MKAQRLVLLGQVHGATITRADVDATDGVRLPDALFDAAGFAAHEKVEVYCLESGTRLGCEAVAGAKPGELEVGGAAALLLKPGARVVIAAWGWVKGKQAIKHEPVVVRVDDDNAPLRGATKR